MLATPDYDRMADAIDYLYDNADAPPRLEVLAAQAGLSPSHFQRLFTRWVGISPKRFAGELALDAARSLLTGGASVMDAAFEAGLSGPSRLHDLFVGHEGVTPGDAASGGAGLVVRYGLADSPFGPCLLAATARGICFLAFIDADAAPVAGRGAGGGMGNAADQLAALQNLFPNAELVEDHKAITGWAARAFAPASAQQDPLPLHLIGTNFQVQVWKALLTIPEGRTSTYQGVAQAIGKPTANRAVAGAVSRNPISYIIPCHRVLRADGGLGGYYYGPRRKKAMLAFEAARAL